MLIETNFHLVNVMGFTANKIAAVLKKNGYKLTPQRRAILTAIALSNEYLTPVALFTKVGKSHPGIGLVTIYRTLDILVSLRLVCVVHTADNSPGYVMRRPSEHHHHLVCSKCGSVVDFVDCDLRELETNLTARTGFKIDSHLLEFSGCCRDCR
jgi:Fur family ferric uptake transcriptional regulator